MRLRLLRPRFLPVFFWGLFLAILAGPFVVRTASFSPAARGGAQEPVRSASDGWANDLTPIGQPDWNYARAAHLIERAGFGAPPEEVQRLAALTPRQAVDEL